MKETIEQLHKFILLSHCYSTISYCYTTNHPRVQWVKSITFIISHESGQLGTSGDMGQDQLNLTGLTCICRQLGGWQDC